MNLIKTKSLKINETNVKNQIRQKWEICIEIGRLGGCLKSNQKAGDLPLGDWEGLCCKVTRLSKKN